MIWDVHFVPDLDFFSIPDPGVKKAPDPGLQHCIQHIFLSARLTWRRRNFFKNYLNFTSFRRISTCRRCERETTGEKCATSLACRAFFMRRHDGFTASAVPRGTYCIVGGGAYSASGAHHQWRKLTVPDIGFWRLLIGCYEGISLSSLLSCTHKSDAYEKKDEFLRISSKSPFHLNLYGMFRDPRDVESFSSCWTCQSSHDLYNNTDDFICHSSTILILQYAYISKGNIFVTFRFGPLGRLKAWGNSDKFLIIFMGIQWYIYVFLFCI